MRSRAEFLQPDPASKAFASCHTLITCRLNIQHKCLSGTVQQKIITSYLVPQISIAISARYIELFSKSPFKMSALSVGEMVQWIQQEPLLLFQWPRVWFPVSMLGNPQLPATPALGNPVPPSRINRWLYTHDIYSQMHTYKKKFRKLLKL